MSTAARIGRKGTSGNYRSHGFAGTGRGGMELRITRINTDEEGFEREELINYG
jgi:hypothetical protein